MLRVNKSVQASDRKYAVLSLATQRSWKGADEEWHSKTEWPRVVAWNGLGEYAATKLRKGDYIYVEGTLVSSTYAAEDVAAVHADLAGGHSSGGLRQREQPAVTAARAKSIQRGRAS